MRRTKWKKRCPTVKEMYWYIPKYGANWQIAYSRLLCLPTYVCTYMKALYIGIHAPKRTYIHIYCIFSALQHDIDVLHATRAVHRHTMYHTMKLRMTCMGGGKVYTYQSQHTCTLHITTSNSYITYSPATPVSFAIHNAHIQYDSD